MRFFPEGGLFRLPANRAHFTSEATLREAMLAQIPLEARVEKCDAAHALHLNLGCMRGIIPREEGAEGIAEGTVRDIALLSRVNKPVCFLISALLQDEEGVPYALCSRRLAQEKCRAEYLSTLQPGDVVEVRVTHCETFGAFCDIGAGIAALLPIDAVSVSRIPHPGARFSPGQEIRAVVRSMDAQGRVTLTHKELLGTWEENAALFAIGETVPGIIRSVESYGIFVELTPNLAGLAECIPTAQAGQSAAVFIKNILPERMKVKLLLVDCFDACPPAAAPRYFFEGTHMDSFLYSPPGCEKRMETIFR